MVPRKQTLYRSMYNRSMYNLRKKFKKEMKKKFESTRILY